jgi:hypothetical protein
LGNDFNLCFGLPLGSSPEGLTSRRPWTARPFRSDPITRPSSLLRAGPPLCPASVLSHSQFQLLVVLPLAASTAGHHYRNDRFSCSIPAPAMSSRHLYTGHHQGHKHAAPRLRAHPERRAFVPGPPTGRWRLAGTSLRCDRCHRSGASWGERNSRSKG